MICPLLGNHLLGDRPVLRQRVNHDIDHHLPQAGIAAALEALVDLLLVHWRGLKGTDPTDRCARQLRASQRPENHPGQAVVDMKVCALALERYYSNGFTYVGADTAVVCTLQSPTQGTAKYTLSYQALSVTDFTIRATPVGGACGMGDCFELARDGTQATP